LKEKKPEKKKKNNFFCSRISKSEEIVNKQGLQALSDQLWFQIFVLCFMLLCAVPRHSTQRHSA
jgi:hypothetical protein